MEQTLENRLATFPLFQDLPDDEIRWLIESSEQTDLEPDTEFYREDVMPDYFYVVLEGELQITRYIGGRQVVLGTTPSGVMGGEVAMMQQIPSQVTARALMNTTLMVWDEEAFRLMFAHAPTFSSRVVKTTGERIANTTSLSAQQEKMAALGKLSAGLAHELNNPASAAQRASFSLQTLLHDLQIRTIKLAELGMNATQVQTLISMQKDVIRKVKECPILSPMEQADREDDIMDYLDGIGVENSWEIAPVYVTAGLKRKDVELYVSLLPEKGVNEILNWACVGLSAATLLDEIENSTERIADLVKAVKSYTYMDRAPMQEVDINQNLVTTLKVMHYKVKSLKVVRELDPNLATIVGRGGELNQVFTNMIDNAVDAMDDDGELRITTRNEYDFVMIEIADNGTGIPDAVKPHIFEPFFTTKDVGKGSGMGLELSYRIVREHGGTIEVQSEAGHTRFIIRLPINTAHMEMI
ncbi:MAG: ATP-binding protein [Chloroflexota bacterium]